MTSPLTDLDELILRCRDDRAKGYIREAVASYRAGAFRSAIVATWVAVCFDFIDKMSELALAGDKEAQLVVADLEKTRAAGDVARALKFEREFLTLARDKFELISPLEYIDLSRLQEDRNRCAHPSLVDEALAFNPSAELARLHITSAVSSMLEHPPAQGKYALERLCKEVESEYFPMSGDQAMTALGAGPLRKPRESLVRNFVVVLIKRIFDPTFDARVRWRTSAALVAVRSLHPTYYSAAMSEKFSVLLRQVSDENLYRIFTVLLRVGDIWQFLAEDMRLRLNNYVAAMPRGDFRIYIDDALTVTELAGSAKVRIKRATRGDLADTELLTITEPLTDRFIDLYLASGSFNEANNWAKRMVSHAGEFSAQQVRRIIQEGGRSADINGSFGIASVINALRQSGKIPAEEFEQLLKDNGFEKYAADG